MAEIFYIAPYSTLIDRRIDGLTITLTYVTCIWFGLGIH